MLFPSFSHSFHLTMHLVLPLLQNFIYEKSIVRIYEHLLIQTHKIAERRQKSIIPRFINGVKKYCSSSAKADMFENSAYC